MKRQNGRQAGCGEFRRLAPRKSLDTLPKGLIGNSWVNVPKGSTPKLWPPPLGS